MARGVWGAPSHRQRGRNGRAGDRGQVIKTTRETRYGVLTLTPEEAGPDAVLELVRDYWGIEIRQHHRRDHPQREDHCQVRHPVAAGNLSLLRSLAIFLYEQQRSHGAARRSWPDWQRRFFTPSTLSWALPTARTFAKTASQMWRESVG